MEKKHFNFLQPVADETKRPVWSVMIPTHNCAQFVKETLESVLIQDPGPDLMHIEVIDDYSNDDVEDIVKAVGRGRVSFFRQQNNVGHIKNFETALERSRGTYIHLLHGDDRLIWGFYTAMYQAFETWKDIGAAFCRHYYIDGRGDQTNISKLLANTSGILPHFFAESLKGNMIQTPSIVVKREVYETIGMFDHRLIYTEDREMWTRIGKHYPIAYIKTPLAEYRISDTSHTSRTIVKGRSWNDQQVLKNILLEHSNGSVDGLEKILDFNIANATKSSIQKLKASGLKQDAYAMLIKTLKSNISYTQRLKLLKAYFLS